MNLFLVDEDHWVSGRMLLAADPVRARKQLVEACQLLANFGTMIKADGTPYGKAHPYHPITKHMAVSWLQYMLCRDVAAGLARVLPNHACSRSFADFMKNDIYRHPQATPIQSYVVCRSGQPQMYVLTRSKYAEVMRAYCRDAKGMKL